MALTKPRISEKPVLLGKRRSLVGVLARATSPAARGYPAVVMLNTGIIHRVGHHRMYVTMSRLLAGMACTVLRFDFAGIGDSGPMPEGLSPVESCLDDIRDVVDWLETEHHAQRVVLIGLCSGADHAVLYGHTDPRVVGLVLMDPSIPATARYYLQYIGRRLMRPHNWSNLVTGRSRILREWGNRFLVAVRRRPPSPQVVLQDLRFDARLERSYQETVSCGVQILAIFTGESTRQTYRDQMTDAFRNVRFGNQLTLEFFQGSDHTFMRHTDRSRLNALVADWIENTDFRRSNELVAEARG